MMYSKKILLIYEQKDIDLVNKIKEFNIELEEKYIHDFKNVDLNNYDIVIIDGLINKLENESLINNLENYSKDIFWIGSRIEDYINLSKKYNIDYIGKTNNIDSVLYKNKEILLSGYDEFNKVKILDKSKVEVLSTIKNSYEEYPYILKNNNMIYMSSNKIIDKDIIDDILNKDLKLNYSIIDKAERIVKTNSKSNEEIKFEQNLKSINSIIVNFIIVILIIFLFIFIGFKYINRRKFRKWE